MDRVLTAVALYAAYIVEAALLGAEREWTPNVVLLVGLAASRNSGVAWAALAGLLCDGLAGRPLGVTMLVATLAVTVGRHVGLETNGRPRLRQTLAAFVGVFGVEALSRMLAGTVAAAPDYVSELLASFHVGIATAGVAIAVGLGAKLLRGAWRRVAGERQSHPPLLVR